MPRLAQKVLNVVGGNTCIHETKLKSDNHALKNAAEYRAVFLYWR